MEENNSRHNRGLIIALIVLGVLMVGLTIGLIIINTRLAEVPGASTRNELNSYIEKIKNDIPFTNNQDMQAVVNLYQSEIDGADNLDAKIKLTEERIDFLTTYDLENQFKEIAISDAKFVDNNLSTLSSCVQVINTAVKYDEQSIVEEYQQILEKREIEEGLMPTYKGKG